MLAWIVTFVLVRLGISASEAAILAPQVVTFLKTAKAVLIALKASGVLNAVERVAKMIGAPHNMNVAEEKLWNDRASDVGAGGG